MDEVLINTTTAGDQGQPSVCGLQGTQFVVVWEDRSDNTIKGQMFGASGVRSSNEILINLPTPPGPRRQLLTIVEYGSGFVVAWTEQAPGSAATAPAQLKLRIFVERNAFVELFCIHARNLLDFFDGKGSPAGGYAAARHFADLEYRPFPNGSAPSKLTGKLSKQVAHITYDRTSDDEKLGGPEIQQLYVLIEEEIESFFKHLKPTYRPEWPDEAAGIRYRVQLPGATCTSSVVTVTVNSWRAKEA